MRVTNGMLINNTLNGLYKNANGLNKLYGQMTTGKKIQTVSDDPIIAGRSLKLKTTVLETSQYQSNAKEANSWMEVTGTSLDNMTEILKTIRTKFLQAANSSLAADDKQAVKTDIMQLYDQILQEANGSYNGRYLFSGYKTNEPMILDKATTLDEDVEIVKDMSFPSDTKVAAGTTLLDGSSLGTGSVLGAGTTIPAGSTLKVGTELSAADAQSMLGITLAADNYTLDADYVVKAGTELTPEAATELGFTVDPNATKYIVETDMTIAAGETLTKETAESVLGVSVSATSYKITQDITMAADTTVVDSVTLSLGCTFEGDITLNGNSSLSGGSKLVEGSILKAGSTLPKNSFNPKVYGQIDGQDISYEIGVNNAVTINTLGMDTVLSDLMGIMEEVAIVVGDSMEADSIYTTEDIYNLFNNKLAEIDKVLNKVSEKTAELGSRMSRLDYVQNRLVDQSTTFKGLLSETEDIDIEEAYVAFNVQYSTYQSALQATSKIITNTLADYL